ncbi:glycosyltransferase family 4 protein [Phocaeicola sartorii]|uniref:glycosyltransferase family 4 protein n=1 Tax=Phocaeicola sartorii TaxID=671267 RepID=UPI0013639499|nr:glycosyltransferase family 4 protein [Phocaeicola sartorii]NBH68383.1 glycosyltransferase [Phocaeicola sartorii]
MICLYYGPITSKGQLSIGGYEAANRKNIDKLRSLGIQVKEYPNPVINKKLGCLGKIVYIKLFSSAMNLLKYKKRSDVVVHITPLYNYLLFPSVFTIWLAKLCRLPSVLDLRAGSFIYYYEHKGYWYKKLVKSILKNSTIITVEGISYLKQIPLLTGIDKEMVYFPNIACNIKLKYVPRKGNTVNIFYFGRITSTKGLDVVIDAIKELDEKFVLYLAGKIADDIDANELKHERIVYLGILSAEQLKEQMQNMHFFIFPTRHRGEGQSNSLIEAMANGLIPIVSEQGFNREVIGDCGVIMPHTSKGKDYANVIRELSKKDMVEMAKKCQQHIHSCHNIDIEIPKLVELYNRILCR